MALRLVGGFGTHTPVRPDQFRLMAAVAPTDYPKSARNRYVIEV